MAEITPFFDGGTSTVSYVVRDPASAGCAVGRDIRGEATVGAERQHSVHVRDGVSEDDLVAMRTARDATLAKPRLIIPAIQVNMRAGRLPPPDAENRRYLKVPLDGL